MCAGRVAAAIGGGVQADPRDADVMGGGEIERQITYRRLPGEVGIHRVQELRHRGVPH